VIAYKSRNTSSGQKSGNCLVYLPSPLQNLGLDLIPGLENWNFKTPELARIYMHTEHNTLVSKHASMSRFITARSPTEVITSECRVVMFTAHKNNVCNWTNSTSSSAQCAITMR